MSDEVLLGIGAVIGICMLFLLGFSIGKSVYANGEKKEMTECMVDHPNYCRTITTYTTDFEKVEGK